MATSSSSPGGPTNPLVSALLTDLYQLTMTYAHWKSGKHMDPSVFELFFRKNPFKGGFTIFCGLDECLKHLQSFSFSAEDLEYLKSTPSLQHAEDEFFDYLGSLTTSSAAAADKRQSETGSNNIQANTNTSSTACLRVHALQEGTIVFPRVPMLIIEAPLGLGQLLETTLLNLVNYPSLLCTNAARMVLRAKGLPCIEFGLRRAQGPDGACSASKYSYVGGFVATSNVQAGRTFGIPISGTHAHSYVQSFTSLTEVQASCRLINKSTAQMEDFLAKVLEHRQANQKKINNTNDGELAAFCAYACAFPNNCLCLIDTYDTLRSGLWNFIFVGLALIDFGYKPKGIRLDSGDLAALSRQCRLAFEEVAAAATHESAAVWKHLTIVASNDINEDTLVQLSQQTNDAPQHAINAFGIGTNLVTCQKQPALGCVYKLVEWKGQPRIKLSQDYGKITIPGRKRAYRLTGADGRALVDYLTLADDNDCEPRAGQAILCRDPFRTGRRFSVIPTTVIPLHSLVFSSNPAETTAFDGSLRKARGHVRAQLTDLFSTELTDYQPTKSYDVMVSQRLFQFLQKIWEEEAPVELLH